MALGVFFPLGWDLMDCASSLISFPAHLKNCLIFYPIEYKYGIIIVRIVLNSVVGVKYYLLELSKVKFTFPHFLLYLSADLAIETKKRC